MSIPKYSPKYEKPLLTAALEPLGDLVKDVHAACKAVKPISARDFDILVDSIKEHGLIRPIEVNRRRFLVDGRCRVLACHVAGVGHASTDIVESSVPPWTIAASNHPRRHLTLDQKAMAAVNLLEGERELAAKRKAAGALKSRRSKPGKLGTESAPSSNDKPK